MVECQQVIHGKLVQEKGGSIQPRSDYQITGSSQGVPPEVPAACELAIALSGLQGLDLGTFAFRSSGALVVLPVVTSLRPYVLAGRIMPRPENIASPNHGLYLQSHFLIIPAQDWHWSHLSTVPPLLQADSAMVERDFDLPAVQLPSPTDFPLTPEQDWFGNVELLLEALFAGEPFSWQNCDLEPEIFLATVVACALACLPEGLAWRVPSGAGLGVMQKDLAWAHGQQSRTTLRLVGSDLKGAEQFGNAAPYLDLLQPHIPHLRNLGELTRLIRSLLPACQSLHFAPLNQDWVEASQCVLDHVKEAGAMANLDNWLAGNVTANDPSPMRFPNAAHHALEKILASLPTIPERAFRLLAETRSWRKVWQDVNSLEAQQPAYAPLRALFFNQPELRDWLYLQTLDFPGMWLPDLKRKAQAQLRSLRIGDGWDQLWLETDQTKPWVAAWRKELNEDAFGLAVRSLPSAQMEDWLAVLMENESWNGLWDSRHDTLPLTNSEAALKKIVQWAATPPATQAQGRLTVLVPFLASRLSPANRFLLFLAAAKTGYYDAARADQELALIPSGELADDLRQRAGPITPFVTTLLRDDLLDCPQLRERAIMELTPVLVMVFLGLESNARLSRGTAARDVEKFLLERIRDRDPQIHSWIKCLLTCLLMRNDSDVRDAALLLRNVVADNPGVSWADMPALDTLARLLEPSVARRIYLLQDDERRQFLALTSPAYGHLTIDWSLSTASQEAEILAMLRGWRGRDPPKLSPDQWSCLLDSLATLRFSSPWVLQEWKRHVALLGSPWKDLPRWRLFYAVLMDIVLGVTHFSELEASDAQVAASLMLPAQLKLLQHGYLLQPTLFEKVQLSQIVRQSSSPSHLLRMTLSRDGEHSDCFVDETAVLRLLPAAAKINSEPLKAVLIRAGRALLSLQPVLPAQTESRGGAWGLFQGTRKPPPISPLEKALTDAETQRPPEAGRIAT